MTTSEVSAFIESFRSVVMASVSPEGIPHASTAPFVREGGRFYILISTVAQHGRNLLSSRTVSLLFAEDEAQTLQPFARKRVTLDAEVSEVDRNDPGFSEGIERFKERFDPDLVASLSGMGDFHLFELSVIGGSAVAGFGKAYRLDQNLEVQTQIVGHHQKGEKHG